ncbi:hypothetical protein FACS1894154_07430 [Betaproteobacteria bacterium]|nr:hypothetical protein FACS1894154_07430 [Betaproteobacteria bacterium]GHU10883.1 hypothetical protein AGMMS50225_15240 [Betaproteobacteria bacterium]GHU24694.1 hypothetical protein FACS189488_09920 [Betaproteobacteria bacterium]
MDDEWRASWSPVGSEITLGDSDVTDAWRDDRIHINLDRAYTEGYLGIKLPPQKIALLEGAA